MAARPIVLWPDPVLKKQAEPVDPAAILGMQAFFDDMVDTMYAADGVGLAAPQVDVSQQIFVIDIADREDEPGSGTSGPKFFINAELLELEGETLFEESCLSLPGLVVDMKRYTRVRVRALDRNGDAFELVAEDLFAIALQHEQDHIDGRLLVEFLTPLKRQLFRTKMLKLKAEEREPECAAV